MSERKWHTPHDFYKLCQRDAVFEGDVFLPDVVQVSDFIDESSDCAVVSLSFSQDNYHRSYIQGSIRVTMRLECQRCAGSVCLDLALSVALYLVKNDAQTVPEGFEPLVMSGQEMTLADLVSDEILLALPAVAVHEDGDCVNGLEKINALLGE